MEPVPPGMLRLATPSSSLVKSRIFTPAMEWIGTGYTGLRRIFCWCRIKMLLATEATRELIVSADTLTAYRHRIIFPGQVLIVNERMTHDPECRTGHGLNQITRCR